MRILAISSDGFGAPIALRLKEEGNEVRFWIKDPSARDIYRGLITKVDDFKPSLSWCDFAVFLNNGLSDIWEVCRKSKPCYGGSSAGQKLEKDRSAAHKLMKSLGMKTPESLGFKTIEEVNKHLKEHKTIHVVKPVGKDMDSDDVFIGSYDDGQDVSRLLDRMVNSGKKFDMIEVEEKIEGIEVGVAGYFDGTKFAPGIEINFQHKPFATGDKGNGIGFLSGEMGTLIRYVDERNPFFKRTLGKMVTYLKSIGYRGEIDIGTIANDQGEWFIEHTPRTGYPDCVIRLELQKTPLSQLFRQIADGNVTENKVSNEWSIGIVMVSPGFPDPKSSLKRSVGLPIFGYEANKAHTHLFEARMGKEGLEISEGGYGYPLVVTGSGRTIQDAQKAVYSLLAKENTDRVYVPKAWWRTDIGNRVINEKEKIKSLAILSEDDFNSRDRGTSAMGSNGKSIPNLSPGNSGESKVKTGN